MSIEFFEEWSLALDISFLRLQGLSTTLSWRYLRVSNFSSLLKKRIENCDFLYFLKSCSKRKNGFYVDLNLSKELLLVEMFVDIYAKSFGRFRVRVALSISCEGNRKTYFGMMASWKVFSNPTVLNKHLLWINAKSGTSGSAGCWVGYLEWQKCRQRVASNSS